MNQESKPKATEAINKNAYVDDTCDSVCSTEEASTLTADIDEVLDSGGFHVKKWITNGEINDANSNEIVIGNIDEAEKALGRVWNPDEDQFSFKVKDTFTQESSETPPSDLSQSEYSTQLESPPQFLSSRNSPCKSSGSLE